MRLMGVPTSEVGYTLAMPRREDHEVHKGHVVALGGKKKNVMTCSLLNKALTSLHGVISTETAVFIS